MILYNPSISGSLVVTGSNISLNGVNVLLSNETSSISVLSSSFASTASYVLNGISSSFSSNALTSSNAMTASSADTLYVRNNVTALGSITAQTLIVQTITSSVLFTTGSNKLGSSLSNTQELTGSVGITGSFAVTTTGTEFQVSAGGVNIGNALTDNHIISGSVTINPNGLFVSSSGNIGIGVTSISPISTYKTLEIRGATGGGIKIGRTGYNPLNIQQDGGDAYLNNVANGAIYFYTNDSEKMSITSGGSVRINTTVGVATLNLKSQASGAILRFQNNASGDGTIFAYGTSTSLDYAFNTYSVGNAFYIANAGNVGIGTSSPSQKLEVIGTTKLSSAAGNVTGINIIPGSVTNIYQTIGDGALGGRCFASIETGYANYDNASSSYMYFKTQSYPATTSDVSVVQMTIRPTGDIRITTLTGTGTRTVVADANGQLSAPVSDKSVKENIRPIGYGIKDIMKMNPVWFEFKDEFKDYGTGRQNGNIAQELEAIIPEAVFLTPQTNRKGIEYGQLHAVYIKAIQELKAENDSLKEVLLRNNIV